MPAEHLALGIDVGTSGVRAIATSRSGKQISFGSASTASPLNLPANWWQACISALDSALSAIDSQSIVAIAVDGTSGTLLGVNSRGEPVGTALMYNEAAKDAVIHQQLAQSVPAGNPAGSSTSGLAKAVELQRRPTVARVIHQADWIIGMLSGDYSHSDENNALKTGYDPIERNWPDWIATAGMRQALLPEVHPVATPCARLAPAIVQRFNLSTETVVATGTTDGCASFLATGASQTGDAVTALGTTLTLKQLVSKPVFNTDYGLYSHRIGDLWLAGGASNTGGAVLDHYFSREQLKRLSASINTEQLLQWHYYPLLQKGERFPINDPQLQPRLTPRPSNDSQFLQAIFEGIAEIEKLGYQRVQELSDTPLRSIRSVGGGATNPQWTNLRQSILQTPFPTAQSTQAASGTAHLAWQALIPRGNPNPRKP